jgi:hypothetical protein
MDYGFNPPFSIIFSSPNPKRFKEFLKMRGSDSFGGLPLIMPPWSLEEVEVGLSRLSTFQAAGRETVLRQFKIYGGVPRILVDKNDEGKLMINTLKLRARSILESAMTKDLLMHSCPTDEEISYKLFHAYPQNASSFKDFTLKAASDYVSTQLEIRAAQLGNKYLKMIESFRGTIFAAAAGKAFELRSYSFLENNTFTISKLHSAKNKEKEEDCSRNISLGYMRALPVKWKMLSSWPTEVLFVDNKNQTLPSVDCFQLTKDGELLLIQIASGRTHAVVSSGLVTILNKLKGHYNSSSLIFAVPVNSLLKTKQTISSLKKYKNDTETHTKLKMIQSSQWSLVISS